VKFARFNGLELQLTGGGSVGGSYAVRRKEGQSLVSESRTRPRRDTGLHGMLVVVGHVNIRIDCSRPVADRLVKSSVCILNVRLSNQLGTTGSEPECSVSKHRARAICEVR